MRPVQCMYVKMCNFNSCSQVGIGMRVGLEFGLKRLFGSIVCIFFLLCLCLSLTFQTQQHLVASASSSLFYSDRCSQSICLDFHHILNVWRPLNSFRNSTSFGALYGLKATGFWLPFCLSHPLYLTLALFTYTLTSYSLLAAAAA